MRGRKEALAFGVVLEPRPGCFLRRLAHVGWPRMISQSESSASMLKMRVACRAFALTDINKIHHCIIANNFVRILLFYMFSPTVRPPHVSLKYQLSRLTAQDQPRPGGRAIALPLLCCDRARACRGVLDPAPCRRCCWSAWPSAAPQRRRGRPWP